MQKKQDCLYLAKNKNPMYISINEEKDILVSSDPICFEGFSENYYTMNDGEFAFICKGEIFFYDYNKKIVIKEINKLEKYDLENDIKNYKHFMIKEIEEQPNILKRLLKQYKEVLKNYNKDFIKKYDSVKLIGCGTAYHAAMIGAKYFEKILKISSTSEIASEFAYNSPLINKKTLYIFISQSGETADTINALELVKEKGATTIALTNVKYSLIAKLADYVLPVCAGKEIAVASTKAYTAQLAGLYLFVKHFTGEDGFNDIEDLTKNIEIQDIEKIMKIANKIKERNDVIFIGKNFDSITAKEGSLKLKETSYINASSYPSGELKHGFIALVEEGTSIISITTDQTIKSKTMNATNEAVSRGAQAYIITDEEIQKDNVINVKAPNTYLMPISSIIPLQLLAYNVSLKRGVNPDQPRNLAKSVTVE